MAKVWESPFCYVISMQQNIKLVQNESFGIGWNIYAPNREKISKRTTRNAEVELSQMVYFVHTILYVFHISFLYPYQNIGD